MRKAFYFLLIIGLTTGAILMEAVVVQQVWSWFIVPAFGLAPLTLVTAIGLSLLSTMLTNHRSGLETTRDLPVFNACLTVVTICLTRAFYVFLTGYIAVNFL